MGLIASQRTGIAGVLNGVTGVGNVFERLPQPAGEWSKFVNTFKVTVGGESTVRAWVITYLGETRQRRTVATIGSQGKVVRQTSWLIRGFVAWNEPLSDAVFGDLIESIANALDLSRTLGGTADDHSAVNVRIPNDGSGMTLGDVLCHAGEIRFTADKDVLIA